MKYKVLNKGYELIRESDLLDILLKERGVENPKRLLNLNEKVLHDGMLFKNMDRGLTMLNWHLKNNSKIHIIDDVDNDGITSATIMDNYIHNIDKNISITHSMNQGKKHGIIPKALTEYDFDLLIVPDAGSENIKECKELVENRDVDILILDHHKMKKENTYAVVINCQDNVYPNDTLSGAGVVYKFIKEYDKRYGYNYADEYLDLTAIGIIGDSMDLRNYETRYLVLKGLKQINNMFIKELIDRVDKNHLENINIEFIGWKISPYLNAVVRVGTDEERLDLMNALLGKEEYREYKPRKSKNNPNPQIEKQILQKAMARECINIKARQDRLVKKGMEELVNKIEDKKLDSNKILIVDGTEIIEQTFTGLVANKLASKYKRPVILLREMTPSKDTDEVYFGGSCRNYNLSPIESLMDFLLDLRTFDFIGGHPNAMGHKIKERNLIETRDKINEKLKDMIIEDVYTVDYEIPVGRLKEKHVKQVGEWKDIWGNTLRKPLFAVTDVTLNIEDIQLLGEKRNIIKFEKNIGNTKLVFIKKFANEEVYNKMIMKNTKGLTKKKTNKIKLDIVCEFVINKWNENTYPQIEIVDFNVAETREFRF